MKTFFVSLLWLISYGNVFAEGVLLNSSVKEVSGLFYLKETGTIFAIEDEGTIFELSLSGEILRQKHLGDYDLEGVTKGIRPGELDIAIEGSDNILSVSIDTLRSTRELSIHRKWEGKKVLKKDKKYGIEGIHNFSGRLFVVNQSYNLNPKKKDPSMLFEVRLNEDKRKYYIYSITYFPFPDLAGLAERDGLLYIISDDEDLILVYDTKTFEVIEQFNNPIPGDQEGITFDESGYMYIAVDGEGIYKVKF